MTKDKVIDFLRSKYNEGFDKKVIEDLSIGRALMKEYECRSKVGAGFYPAELELIVRYFEGNYLCVLDSAMALYSQGMQENNGDRIWCAFRCAGIALKNLRMLKRLDPKKEYLIKKMSYKKEETAVNELSSRLYLSIEFPDIGDKIAGKYKFLIKIGNKRGSYFYNNKKAKLDELIDTLREQE